MSGPTGKLLGGCELRQAIGAGGMATVYNAYQLSMQREVAVKIMRQELSADDPTFYARFVQEAHMTASLEHQNILSVYNFGQDFGYVYLIMRRMERSLSELLREQGMLPLNEVARMLRQIADALDYAHSRGVIHRDLKPSNVLLDRQANCYLSDFGMAFLVDGKHRLTANGQFVGTPAYVAPEQVRGGRASKASDIYSLGVMAYELVCGAVPFMAETPSAVIYQHLENAPADPRKLRPDLPKSASEVILRALAKLPADRWENAHEMVMRFSEGIGITNVQNASVKSPGQAIIPFSQRMPVPMDVGQPDPSTYIAEVDSDALVQPGKRYWKPHLRLGSNLTPGKYRVLTVVALLIMLLLLLVSVALPSLSFHGNPAAPNATGVAALANLNYNVAVQQFQLSLQNDPHYAPAYYNLGVAYEEMGDLGQAQDAYSKAIQFDSRMLLARYRLSQLLLDAKTIDQGFRVIDVGIKIFEESDTAYTDDARQQLMFDLYATRGRAYLLRQADESDLALAESDLLHALTAKKAVAYAAPAYHFLALLYEQRGDQAKAQQAWLDMLVSYDPNSDQQRQWAAVARQKVQSLEPQ